MCLICTGCQRLNSFSSLNWKHFLWENMKIIQEEQYIAFHVRGIENSFNDSLNVIWKYQAENQNHNPMKVDTTLLIWDTSVIWYKLYKYTSSFEMSVGNTLEQQNMETFDFFSMVQLKQWLRLSSIRSYILWLQYDLKKITRTSFKRHQTDPPSLHFSIYWRPSPAILNFMRLNGNDFGFNAYSIC